MSPLLIAFFAFAVPDRLDSLIVSKRNDARLRAEGAEEFGAANSRLITVLHVAFYFPPWSQLSCNFTVAG